MTPNGRPAGHRCVKPMQDEMHPAGRGAHGPGRRRHLGPGGRGSLTCAAVGELLPALAGGEIGASRRVRAHVAVCLRCQAEMARYRRQARQLRELRDEPILPSPALAAQVVAGIDAAWVPRGSRVVRNIACVGGISVATVAGAGVLVWMGRRRLVAAG
jgi:anti-sigma factor RsiW